MTNRREGKVSSSAACDIHADGRSPRAGAALPNRYSSQPDEGSTVEQVAARTSYQFERKELARGERADTIGGPYKGNLSRVGPCKLGVAEDYAPHSAIAALDLRPPGAGDRVRVRRFETPWDGEQ